MGRKPKGTLQWFGDVLKARVTLPDGTRPWVDVPPGLSEVKAREFAAEATKLAREGGAILNKDRAAKPRKNETFKEWFERWCDAREARGVASVDHAKRRARVHLYPLFGVKFVWAIDKRDIERLVERLDKKARANEISWRYARLIWGDVTKAFRDMSRGKEREFRVREDNPTNDVEGPDRGEKKEKQFLYPSEFSKLVSRDEVPLENRRLFALMVYLYVRPGELRALDWADVDLEHNTVHVTKALARKKQGEALVVKPTKTTLNRTVPIEPELAPLLRAMRDEAGGAGRVVHRFTSEYEVSRELKRALGEAGVTRGALFANDLTTKGLTFYDLRATGITWRCIRGDHVTDVRDAAGHKNIGTTDGYIRRAQPIRHAFATEKVFPSLSVLYETSKIASNDGGEYDERLKNKAIGERAQHDSNLDFSYESTEKQAVSRVGTPELAIRDHTQVDAETRGLDDSRRYPIAPPTLRDELAALVARAVASGELALAKALIDAASKSSPAPVAGVIDINAERAKRGGDR